MKKTIAKLFAAPLLLACTVLLAQNITSSIVGNVGDPSGAPVAGADVTISNTETGAVRKTTTDASGLFSVPALLAGTYDVTVEKSGFATYREKAVVLLSGQSKRVNVKLSIGSVQQTVEVTGEAPLVQTDSMTIGNSVSDTQLNNLPTSLQTVDAFIALAPGVQTAGDATNPQIGGGTHWGSVNFNVNGVSNNDPGNSGGATVQGVGLLVMPPPSSIQELQVQANGMDARYRNKSSVSLVTKGGTNALHFQLFEYLQNPMFNANSYVNNAKGIAKPGDHLNQFGGNVGGPIVKNKLFFFFDYSGYRKKNSGTAQEIYPTQAMRTGDFSALCTAGIANGLCVKGGTQLYNPFTGKPFLNNQIPASMFASQSVKLLKYLPLPTDPTSTGLPSGKTNYFESIPIEQDVDGEDVRVDYNMRPSDQIFGVFAQRLAVPWNSFANWPSTFGQLRYGYKNFTASASETHIFSPTMINTFRAGWADYATKFSGLNQDVNPKDLFPQMPETFFRGLPQINTSGYGNSNVLLHDYGTGAFTPRWDWEFTDDFTYTRGKHTIQAGLDETGYKIESRKGSSTGDPPTGLFAFSGQWTGNHGWPGQPTSNGNSFADFLLGTVNSDATAWQGNFAAPIYSRDWGAYVQDTWQASSKLTLILGLRYEYQSPWKYRSPMTTTFDLKTGKMVLSEDSATPVFQPGNMDAALFNAFPYETTKSLGMPVYYIQPDRNNFSPRIGFAFRPYERADTVIRGGYGIYYNFQPGFVGSRTDGQNQPWLLSVAQPFTTALPAKPAQPFLPDLTFANPFGSSSAEVVSPNPSLSFLQWDFQNAKVQEWTLTLEQNLGGWVTRLSYVGNHTDHLPYNGGQINIPDVQQPNVRLQDQRPYQPFSGITETRSLGIQNFHQLQAGLIRRFAHGFSFQGEYEFTRSLDDVAQGGGPQRPLHPMLDYGNSDGIRRHWLIFNYVYELPFGRGRHWLGGSNGFMDAVFGGWGVSGITTYATGAPFNVGFSIPTKYQTSWFGGRPDVVPGVPLYSNQSHGHDVIAGVPWFNLDAFAPPQPWQWGNARRNMLFGPGFVNWDISGQKSFAVTERMRVKFKADFFDAFNHFNPGNPNGTIADTRDGGLPNAFSGLITGGSGARTIQLGLTLQY